MTEAPAFKFAAEALNFWALVASRADGVAAANLDFDL